MELAVARRRPLAQFLDRPAATFAEVEARSLDDVTWLHLVAQDRPELLGRQVQHVTSRRKDDQLINSRFFEQLPLDRLGAEPRRRELRAQNRQRMRLESGDDNSSALGANPLHGLNNSAVAQMHAVEIAYRQHRPVLDLLQPIYAVVYVHQRRLQYGENTQGVHHA